MNFIFALTALIILALAGSRHFFRQAEGWPGMRYLLASGSANASKTMRLLLHWEKWVYLLFLTLAGALWGGREPSLNLGLALARRRTWPVCT